MSVPVCLIRVPTLFVPKSLSFYESVPPIGLAYIAAVTREAGHPVQVIDAPGEALDTFRPYETSLGELTMHGLTLEEVVARVKPDTKVIGISHMFLHEWPLIRQLVAQLKARLPAALIALGGENPTGMWRDILEQAPEVGCCVLGEGEETFVELLAAVDEARPLHEVKALALRDAAGAPVTTGTRPRLRAVDKLPWPAWDLFNVDGYLDRSCSSGVDRGRSMPMLTSRGCPYKCTFCSSPTMWTTRYFARDRVRVADEMAHYIERYGITNVDFNDLTAVLTKKWIMAFCDEVQKRGIDLSWQLPSGTRSEAIDEEAARTLYQSGCRNFGYAPESGSARILDLIQKKVKLPRMLNSLAGAVRSDLKCHSQIIIGLPDETPRDLALTWWLIVQMAWVGAHTCAVQVFAPYPGSKLYNRLREEGRITFDDRYIYSALLKSSGGGLRTYHPTFTPQQIVSFQMFCLLSFFSVQYARRPQRVLEIARNLATGDHQSVMEKFLSTKFKQWFGRRGQRWAERVRAGAAMTGMRSRPAA